MTDAPRRGRPTSAEMDRNAGRQFLLGAVAGYGRNFAPITAPESLAKPSRPPAAGGGPIAQVNFSVNSEPFGVGTGWTLRDTHDPYDTTGPWDTYLASPDPSGNFAVLTDCWMQYGLAGAIDGLTTPGRFQYTVGGFFWGNVTGDFDGDQYFGASSPVSRAASIDNIFAGVVPLGSAAGIGWQATLQFTIWAP